MSLVFLRTSPCAVFLLTVFACCVPVGAQYTAVDLYTMNPAAGFNFSSPATYHASDNGRTVGWAGGGSHSNAMLWSSNGTGTNLNPTNILGFVDSFVQGIGGGQQVGYGSGPATGSTGANTFNHALIWSGAANTAIDLHPTSAVGYTSSAAYGTDGVHQAGYAIYPSSGGGYNHAMVWSGSAASAVDLQPTQFGAGYYMSMAFAVSGNQQAGFMTGSDAVNIRHAMLWTGTAASAVDLHPNNLPIIFGGGSTAVGIGGGQEVGYASYNAGASYSHAMLWTGTGASAVDLNPAGGLSSFAYFTNGTRQAGYLSVDDPANFSTLPHAMVWSGTAASAIDLQLNLPSSFRASTAYSVNSAGDVFGTAFDTTGGVHAVEWTAAPHIATGNAPAGSNQSVTVAGRSPTAGDVKAAFTSTSGGTFSNTSSLTTISTISSQTSSFNFAIPNPSGLVQTWDLSYTGSISGPATLTFHFDPANLADGTDLSSLAIAHFTGGQWVTLAGTVDPIADTITVSTNSFSPFALVPEPSSFAMLAIGSLCLLSRRRTMSLSVTADMI